MILQWSARAIADLDRIRSILGVVNPEAAVNILRALESAALRLLEFPRLGEQLAEFDDREVRRILVRTYEVRYEMLNTTIFILSVRHTRQRR